MHKATHLISKTSILIALAVGMFCYGCKNERSEIDEFLLSNDGPSELSEDVEMTYSDGGIIQIRMKAPMLEKFSKAEGVEVVWPKGIDVTFYDSVNVIKSHLLAKKAYLYEDKKYMLVQNNVVFSNVEGEKLETEELKIFFDQDSLYTDKFVKITTKDGVITGQKLISNLAFTRYRISEIRDSYYNIEIEEQK